MFNDLYKNIQYILLKITKPYQGVYLVAVGSNENRLFRKSMLWEGYLWCLMVTYMYNKHHGQS